MNATQSIANNAVMTGVAGCFGYENTFHNTAMVKARLKPIIHCTRFKRPSSRSVSRLVAICESIASEKATASASASAFAWASETPADRSFSVKRNVSNVMVLMPRSLHPLRFTEGNKRSTENSRFRNPDPVGILNGTAGSLVAAASSRRRWQSGKMPLLQVPCLIPIILFLA